MSQPSRQAELAQLKEDYIKACRIAERKPDDDEFIEWVEESGYFNPE